MKQIRPLASGCRSNLFWALERKRSHWLVRRAGALNGRRILLAEVNAIVRIARRGRFGETNRPLEQVSHAGAPRVAAVNFAVVRYLDEAHAGTAGTSAEIRQTIKEIVVGQHVDRGARPPLVRLGVMLSGAHYVLAQTVLLLSCVGPGIRLALITSHGEFLGAMCRPCPAQLAASAGRLAMTMGVATAVTKTRNPASWRKRALLAKSANPLRRNRSPEWRPALMKLTRRGSTRPESSRTAFRERLELREMRWRLVSVWQSSTKLG